jgi:hypothetical protein
MVGYRGLSLYIPCCSLPMPRSVSSLCIGLTLPTSPPLPIFPSSPTSPLRPPPPPPPCFRYARTRGASDIQLWLDVKKVSPTSGGSEMVRVHLATVHAVSLCGLMLEIINAILVLSLQICFVTACCFVIACVCVFPCIFLHFTSTYLVVSSLDHLFRLHLSRLCCLSHAITLHHTPSPSITLHHTLHPNFRLQKEGRFPRAANRQRPSTEEEEARRRLRQEGEGSDWERDADDDK